ncbi:hypothetical protein Taro_004516 [Colocasia esculenta]|uniref:Plastid division protein CDP1, chloroplastic n=1 Tax=Colocasia esculenta TaxID=4460 RepID=A0A843TKD4_COLES|nr:hypothetical protein [Colocasia esculenta]
MALARAVLCSVPPSSSCRSGAAEGPRGGSAFLVSAGSPVCAGDGVDNRVLRRVLDGGPPPAGCRGVVVRGRVKLSDAPAVENGQVRSSVEIPVTCYQIIGVSEKAEKDQVVKTVMELKGSDIEDGYTMDVILSRQDLLMDVRDKLLFEPEYAGDIKEKVPPKASLHIPWTWLPAALCLLQEVGEDKLVLDIGRVALQHQDAKSYTHDLLLAMALAECSIAKIAFEKNKVSQGFEALARAQYFLRSRPSLEKMSLLSQIEESLEELAPACTLELLSLPQTPENGERRRKAIAALQELLRQGLEVETSCRVQDWPCFLSHALNKLMAAEIVDLLSWDTLAATRKNKKSLESQNQRIIIDFSCFYVAMIAHIALGFSTRQKELVGFRILVDCLIRISKAKNICDCLIASEGMGLKFEESLCSLLLGQGLEKAAVEKLHQLQVNGSPVLSNMEFASSNKEPNGKTDANQSLPPHLRGKFCFPKYSSTTAKPVLSEKTVIDEKPLELVTIIDHETWLKESVLGVFPDTRDCSPSLANYFGGQKRLLNGVNYQKGSAKAIPDMGRKPSSCLSLEHKSMEDANTHGSSTRHLGEAVKQLAPPNIENQLTVDKINSNTSKPSMPLKTNKHGKGIVESCWTMVNTSGTFAYVAMLGCLVFSTVKLGSTKFGHSVYPSRLNATSSGEQTSTSSWIRTSRTDSRMSSDSADHSNVVSRLLKQFKMLEKELKRPTDAGSLENARSPDVHLNLSKASAAAVDMTHKRKMPLEEAEALLRKWQAIKAEALGPSHQIEILSDILSEAMLSQWKALAKSAKRKSCFWRFVLLRSSVLHADIVSDGVGGEMAEIGAVLEEAAELVDGTQRKNPNYYSSYKILYMLKREQDGSWRFCEGGIQESL